VPRATALRRCESVPAACWALSSRARARATATQKHTGAEKVTKVVPATGVWKSVDAMLGEDATDEAKEDREAVEKASPKSGWLERLRWRLRCTGGKNRSGDH